MAAVAGAAAWACLGWVVSVLALTLLGAVGGAASQVAAAALVRIAPPSARHLAAAVLGLSVVAGPAAAAGAADLGSGSLAVAAASVAAVEGRTADPLDRPAAPPSTLSATPPAGWTADRPAPGRRSAPSPPVRLVTSTPVPQAALDDESLDLVVVRRGDCLWDVAARAMGPSATDGEIAVAWPRWYAANAAVIGPDPALLLPGQLLRTPPLEGTSR